MMELSCAQLGDGMCDYTARGDTAEAVKQQMFDHAAKAHPEMMATMTPEQQADVAAKMDHLLA